MKQLTNGLRPLFLFLVALFVNSCSKHDASQQTNPTLPVFTTASANPNSVAYSGTSLITASADNSTVSILDSNGTVLASGNNTINYPTPKLTWTSKFGLRASNSAGTISNTINITVAWDPINSYLASAPWKQKKVETQNNDTSPWAEIVYDGCFLDDMTTFTFTGDTTGRFLKNFGTNHCDPGEVDQKGDISLTANKTILIWGGASKTIKTLDANTLVLFFSSHDIGGTGTSNYRVTYGH